MSSNDFASSMLTRLLTRPRSRIRRCTRNRGRWPGGSIVAPRTTSCLNMPARRETNSLRASVTLHGRRLCTTTRRGYLDMTSSTWWFAPAASLAVALTIVSSAQQPDSGGLYTAAQAARGKSVYDERCAGCHLADLRGARAPQLAGAAFLAAWGNRTARELIETIKTTMPPDGVGTLS